MIQAFFVGDVCQVCWIQIPQFNQAKHAKYHDEFHECYKCQAFVPYCNRHLHDRYHNEMESRITNALTRAMSLETQMKKIQEEYPA